MKIFKIILPALLLVMLGGCNDQKVGFLEVENAVYVPNTMDIRLVLDEELDAYRKANNAPWVSPRIQGVIGTNPITYQVENVTSELGDAELFRSLVTIRGGARLQFPLVSDITPGEYQVSVRVINEGYSYVLDDIFTFVVK